MPSRTVEALTVCLAALAPVAAHAAPIAVAGGGADFGMIQSRSVTPKQDLDFTYLPYLGLWGRLQLGRWWPAYAAPGPTT